MRNLREIGVANEHRIQLNCEQTQLTTLEAWQFFGGVLSGFFSSIICDNIKCHEHHLYSFLHFIT